MVRVEENTTPLRMNFEGWRKAEPKAGRWFRRVEEGAEAFMRKCHEVESVSCRATREGRDRATYCRHQHAAAGGAGGGRGHPAQAIKVLVWPSSS